MDALQEFVKDLEQQLNMENRLYSAEEIGNIANRLLEDRKFVQQSRYEFTFDLKNSLLRENYPKGNINQAWADIRRYMVNHDFAPIGDSDYLTNEPMKYLEFIQFTNDFRKNFPWFEICSQKAVATTVYAQSDIKRQWNIEDKIAEQVDIFRHADKNPEYATSEYLQDALDYLESQKEEYTTDEEIQAWTILCDRVKDAQERVLRGEEVRTDELFENCDTGDRERESEPEL